MGMAWHMKTYYYCKINIYKILIQKQEIVAHILDGYWVCGTISINQKMPSRHNNRVLSSSETGVL